MDDQKEVEIHSEIPGLIPKVLEFIQSATYPEKGALIQKYPELLGQEADHILEQIEHVWESRGDEAARGSIQNWRDFLRRVAASDFEVTVLEDAVYKVFVELPFGSTARDYLDKLTDLHPQLLNERADEAVRSVKARLTEKRDEDSVVVAEILDAILGAIREQRIRKNVLRQARDKMQSQPKKKSRSVFDLLD